jgi:hypothetical protein
LIRWVIGLVIAITIHTAYNNVAFHQFVFGQTGLLVLVAIAFAALLFVAVSIAWGLRRQRQRLRKSLGMSATKGGEARLVRNAEELDELLAPVGARFGEAKQDQAANALLLAAQLAMKQEQIRKTRDPELRAELAPQITELKQELRQARHEVGIYVMTYVRSIMPKATWSLWARLGQTLTKLGPPKVSVWQVVETRLPGSSSAGEGIYARVRVELYARAREMAAAAEGES